MEKINVITKPGEGEYTEKKSRFIGYAFPISGEAEAQLLIDQIKRKHWDARHNCYAFITGEKSEICRFSDDGEPGGTAGRPILEVMSGRNLANSLVVVTRYFGGTLLGTGGLVRAYSEATRLALESANISELTYACRILIKTTYTASGKLQYYISQAGINLEDTTYTDMVEMTITVPEPDASRICDEMTGLVSGNCELSIIDTGFFVT